MLDAIRQDVAYAVRTLRKAPAYTAVAVATLALGIGANTAIFSVIHGVMLRPLPFANGDRIVLLEQPATHGSHEMTTFSVSEVADYRAQTRTFDGLVEYHSMSFNLLGRGEPQRVQTGVVSANFFDVLGVRPLAGRTFRPGEDAPGAQPVLVLSYAYWMNRLGGDPTIVGKTVEMTDRIHTVVGILPPLPQYPDENDVYMPVSSCPFRISEAWLVNRDFRALTVFGVTKKGVGLERVRSDVDAVARRLHADHPDAYPANQGFETRVTPLGEQLTARARPTLFILLATAGLVLLIACANVANLTLVRLIRRERELAVRAALGAARTRLARQLLTESTLLAVAGAALGLLIAFGGVDLLRAFAERFTPRAHEIAIDVPVLLFTLTVSVATGAAFGAIPLLSLGRRLAAGLQQRSAGAVTDTRGSRLSNVLVMLQIAVSLVLLVAAGLAIRSLDKLRRVDGGFVAENVLSMRLTPSRDRYTTPELRLGLTEQLLQRINSEPGVISAAFTGIAPLGGGHRMAQSLFIQGRPTTPGEGAPDAEVHVASRDYFKTIGVPLLQGRGFADTDRRETPRVALVNLSLARRGWPGSDPVGARISLDGENWATVIGVVGDVRHYGLAEPPANEIFVSGLQSPLFGGSLLIRTAGDPTRMSRRAVAAVHEIDPQLPVDNVRTLDQVRDNSIAASRLTASLLALFATLALVIAAAGIGGVIAFSVSQRTHEFGIRMALGAARSQVLGMVLRQGLVLTAVGLLAGVAGSHWLTRFMSGLVFGVEATDLPTYIVVCAVLAAVGVVASLGPARRATKVDPLTALRSE